MEIKTLFETGDKIIIDECRDLVAVVLAVQIRGSNITYQVSWVQDGCLREPWVEEWRMEKWVG